MSNSVEFVNWKKTNIQLAACSKNEILPMKPELPADLFTSCLTSPIKASLRWFVLNRFYVTMSFVSINMLCTACVLCACVHVCLRCVCVCLCACAACVSVCVLALRVCLSVCLRYVCVCIYSILSSLCVFVPGSV